MLKLPAAAAAAVIVIAAITENASKMTIVMFPIEETESD